MSKRRTIIRELVNFLPLLIAIAAVLILLIALYPSGANADGLAYTTSFNVKPGQSLTYANGKQGFNCGHSYFTHVHVTGDDIGSQHRASDYFYWPSFDDGRVTFNGITFTNTTRATAHVSALCSPVSLSN